MTRRLFFGYLIALLCVLATLAASRQFLVALRTDSDAARTQHTAALKGLVELRGAAHELMDGVRTLERGTASA
ncbi:MAG: hypothetical protein HY329_20435, partial [Chloroflexi bacterium]|nr:hypothetical protein [Chloroflexota bacterium]